MDILNRFYRKIAKIKFKSLYRYLASLLVVVICVGGYIVWERQESRQAIVLTEEQMAEQVVIDEWYSPLIPIMIGPISVKASVANTTETRTKGLSGTPFLPETIVKLFVFDTSEEWGFWMKDMKYPIDIIWIDAYGVIVSIEKSISPTSYPMSFIPNQPAKYVIETTAGFTENHDIKIGDKVSMPDNI